MEIIWLSSVFICSLLLWFTTFIGWKGSSMTADIWSKTSKKKHLNVYEKSFWPWIVICGRELTLWWTYSPRHWFFFYCWEPQTKYFSLKHNTVFGDMNIHLWGKWNKYRRLATFWVHTWFHSANHGATPLLVHVKHESTAKIRHRKSENVRDSVVALIWCQTLMPVRFKGHCFQIHPVSVQQPLRSNMLRPSARKRLLTASKFPASPPSHRQRIRLPFFFFF